MDKDEKADEDGEEENATNPFFNQSRVGVFLYRFFVGWEVGLIPVARKAPFLSIPFQKFLSNFGKCGAFKAYTGYEVHEVHKEKRPPGDPFSLPKAPFQTSIFEFIKHLSIFSLHIQYVKVSNRLIIFMRTTKMLFSICNTALDVKLLPLPLKH